MQWIDYIQNINRDDIDNEAIKRYSLWRSKIMENINIRFGRKQMIYLHRLDPDILNEFCFYTPKFWDRLVQRAKMFYDENDFPYEKKMQRAIMVLYGTDPDVIPDENIPTQLWVNGGLLNFLYQSAMQYWNDNSITFDNLIFSFNRFTEALSVTVNDGSGRTYHLTRTDIVFPPDIETMLFDTHSKTATANNISSNNEEVSFINTVDVNDESGWLPM